MDRKVFVIILSVYFHLFFHPFSSSFVPHHPHPDSPPPPPLPSSSSLLLLFLLLRLLYHNQVNRLLTPSTSPGQVEVIRCASIFFVSPPGAACNAMSNGQIAHTLPKTSCPITKGIMALERNGKCQCNLHQIVPVSCKSVQCHHLRTQ